MADTTTTPRTDIDIAAFKARLEALKASSEETIARMRSQDADGMNTTGTDRAEPSEPGNHPADLGTEVQMRTQDAALIENEQNTIRQIERALAKIADGTYGYSDQSGVLIPAERLDAMPFATVTVGRNRAPSDYVTATDRYQNG